MPYIMTHGYYEKNFRFFSLSHFLLSSLEERDKRVTDRSNKFFTKMAKGKQ